MHSVAEAKAAFGLAREVFERVSFDLIYARQGQGWEPGGRSWGRRWRWRRITCRFTS
jgi:hypothetical protein